MTIPPLSYEDLDELVRTATDEASRQSILIGLCDSLALTVDLSPTHDVSVDMSSEGQADGLFYSLFVCRDMLN
jgi:hypothetical protein